MKPTDRQPYEGRTITRPETPAVNTAEADLLNAHMAARAARRDSAQLAAETAALLEDLAAHAQRLAEEGRRLYQQWRALTDAYEGEKP